MQSGEAHRVLCAWKCESVSATTSNSDKAPHTYHGITMIVQPSQVGCTKEQPCRRQTLDQKECDRESVAIHKKGVGGWWIT